MNAAEEIEAGAELERAEMLQRRMDVADEMLAKLADDIGTGPGVANLRAQVVAIKHELRGLRRTLVPARVACDSTSQTD